MDKENEEELNEPFDFENNKEEIQKPIENLESDEEGESYLKLQEEYFEKIASNYSINNEDQEDENCFLSHEGHYSLDNERQNFIVSCNNFRFNGVQRDTRERYVNYNYCGYFY